MYANGTINFEKFKLSVKNGIIETYGNQKAEAVANDIVNNCRNTEGNSPGQIAGKILNCMIKHLQV